MEKIGKGVSYYDSSELSKILGKKTSEIKKSLGYDGRNEIVHRDYLTLNDKQKQIEEEVLEIGIKAKEASLKISSLSSQKKNDVLLDAVTI